MSGFMKIGSKLLTPLQHGISKQSEQAGLTAAKLTKQPARLASTSGKTSAQKLISQTRESSRPTPAYSGKAQTAPNFITSAVPKSNGSMLRSIASNRQGAEGSRSGGIRDMLAPGFGVSTGGAAVAGLFSTITTFAGGAQEVAQTNASMQMQNQMQNVLMKSENKEQQLSGEQNVAKSETDEVHKMIASAATDAIK